MAWSPIVEGFSRFRFKSITHRLIFGCVVAAIVIYTVSYWQMRSVVRQGGETWSLQTAQAHIEAVAAQITGPLQAIEQAAQLVGQADRNGTAEALLPTLMAQQPQIRAVMGIHLPSPGGAPSTFGLQTDKPGTYEALSPATTSRLLPLCQPGGTPTQPFWTQPYHRPPLQGSWGVTYCAPLAAASAPSPSPGGMLAIELSLDWLPPLVTRPLPLVDQFFQYKLEPPFVIVPSTQQWPQQWLVPPSETLHRLSWFSQTAASNPFRQALATPPAPSPQPQTLKDTEGILLAITLPSTAWILGIILPYDELINFSQRYVWVVILSMAKDMTFMCIAIAIVSRFTTGPLQALTASAEDMAQGNLDTTFPVIPYRDEVGRLAKAFRHMRDALKDYIRELQDTTAAKQKMESELAIAAQIQRSMVPRIELADGSHPRYELSALFQPARVVGGDLYDFFALGEDHLCFVIGDVADKGVAAALLMARTVTLLRTMAKHTSNPTEILAAINEELCINNDECLFVTVLCAVLDLRTGSLVYASGGHEPPLRMRDGSVQFLELETGPPLGLDEAAIFPHYACGLQANDILLLYTDGITEAMNGQGDFFSEERLIETLTAYAPSTPARTIRLIQYFHRQFVVDAPQSDDMTLLVLKYQPSRPFPQEMNIVEWTLTINSKLTELESVNQRLGEILQGERIAVEAIEDIQLIVEEVLVNIIHHGYENQESNRIDLQVKISAKILQMVFEDWGKPFNPLIEVAPPDLSMDDARRALGSLGFYLVRELSDHIDYRHEDGKNILTIVKNVSRTS